MDTTYDYYFVVVRPFDAGKQTTENNIVKHCIDTSKHGSKTF